MLYRIFGPSGSGKSSYIIDRIKQSVKAGTPCLYIVPEQQSVAAERSIAHALGDRGALFCDVLNFERLPDLVGRKEGGIAVTYIDKGGRDLLLSLVLIKVRGKLTEYASCCLDAGFVQKVSRVISRFKAEGIDSARLLELCGSESISDNELLCRKLHDMAVILAEYESSTASDLRDPLDSLSALSSRLETLDFFGGKDVFIDGYYTFTGQEYEIIGHMCRQCKNIYITFVDDGRALFADNRAAADRIKLFSRECLDVSVGEFKRSESADIRHIEQYLWSSSFPAAPSCGDINVVYAKNIFEECEAIASYISDRAMHGARYRDISIISGNATEYNDILESVLTKNGIPCFTSHKEPVISKPLFAYVLSVIQMTAEDFSLPSVRRCLKSGFSPLSNEQCDFLLRYAEMWNIRGKAWYSDIEWLMNPDGYDTITDSAERLRVFINKARRIFVDSVMPLHDILASKETTVGDAAKAIYAFMQDMDIQKKVTDRASLLQKAGDADGAMREAQVYDCMIALLDQMYLVARDEVIDVSSLSDLIEIMCSEYTVGSIPSSADAVTVGDPSLFRADNCKVTVICGLTDGVFPSYGSSDDFFDEDELVILEGEGMTAAIPRDSFIRRERFLFYVACTSASEKILLTAPLGGISGEKKRRSLGLLHLISLFSDITPRVFGTEISDRIFSAPSAIDCYISLPDGDFKTRLASAVTSAGGTLPSEQSPIFDPEADVEFKRQREFGLSPSALERYVYCPFSYFASRLMHLKKTERLRFAEAQTGTLMHKALEEYMRKCTENGVFVPMSASEASAEADRVISQYFQASGDTRYSALTRGIKRTLTAVYDDIAREFSVCDFMPVGFEVKLGNGWDGSKKAMRVSVDGTDVYVRGVADRVDVTEVDGVKYVRIVDYKTGGKMFNMSLIDEGIDMQMPMYLFSLCDELGAKPAGCTYYSARLKFASRKEGETDEQFKKRLYKCFSRSGIVGDDVRLIAKYDRTHGAYLPVRLTKEGTVYSSDTAKAFSEDRFADLQKKLAHQMVKVAEGIFDGRMHIAPKHIDGVHDSCKYCKYRGACRYERR